MLKALGQSDPREWAIGTSTCLFTGEFNDNLRECAAAGISHIELGLGSAIDNPEGIKMLAQRAAAIKAAGLQLWSVHLPFGTRWDFNGPDKNFTESIVDTFASALENAVNWGAQKAVVHPSWEPIAPEIRQEYLQRSKDVLQRLADVGSALGITLAVECLPRTCLGNCSADILALLEGSSSLQVCFDANHMLTEYPEEFVRNVGNRIVTVHISDYDRINERHWLPGRGVTNWTAVIAALVQCGYKGPFMYEVPQQKDASPVKPQDLVNIWQGLLATYLEKASA